MPWLGWNPQRKHTVVFNRDIQVGLRRKQCLPSTFALGNFLARCRDVPPKPLPTSRIRWGDVAPHHANISSTKSNFAACGQTASSVHNTSFRHGEQSCRSTLHLLLSSEHEARLEVLPLVANLALSVAVVA